MRSQANLAACGLCRYELPFAAKWMIDAHKVDAVIAVGYSPPTLISRPQPPSSRQVALWGWIERIPEGTRQNDGLKTGMMGAAAARSAWGGCTRQR